MYVRLHVDLDHIQFGTALRGLSVHQPTSPCVTLRVRSSQMY
jgi:hypothetical protein